MPRFRSKLEAKVAPLLGADWEYEKTRVKYTVAHTYTPDFTKGHLVVEVKGYFRPGDQRKYLAINEEIRRDGKELVFIFSNPNKPVRKGAKLTHGKWCDKHGIAYYAVADCKEALGCRTKSYS